MAETGTGLAPLESIDGMEFADGWAPLPPVAGVPGWARNAAGMLSANHAVQESLVRTLEAYHPVLIEERHVLVGVWVPHPDVPEISGSMKLDWRPAEDEGITRAAYRTHLEGERRKNVTVLSQSVEETTVAAGEVLVVHEVLASKVGRFRKEVQAHTVYSVFPPDCSDAVQLRFATWSMDLADQLVLHAQQAAESLRVTVGWANPGVLGPPRASA